MISPSPAPAVPPIAPGSCIPLVNITVFYNATVTSRLLATGTTNVPSEALLLIDEPGSGLPGYGPSLPQMLCTTPLTGCPAWVGSRRRVAGGATLQHGNGSGAPHAGSQRVSGCITCRSICKPRRDVLRCSGVAPDHDRFARLPHHQRSRRCYASDWRFGFRRFAGSGEHRDQRRHLARRSRIRLRSSAYVSAGLTASASSATNLNQCSTQTKTSVNTLTFTENFGTAFKTRVAAQTNNSVCRPDRQSGQQYPRRTSLAPSTTPSPTSSSRYPRELQRTLVWRISELA